MLRLKCHFQIKQEGGFKKNRLKNVYFVLSLLAKTKIISL